MKISLEMKKLEREVSYNEGMEFAAFNRLAYFEISALLNQNISEAMQYLASEIIER